MAASPHSWDFLLLRLRELRLPLLRGSASRTSGPTAKSIADILPRGGWQSKISGSAPPPINEIGSAIQLALGNIITNTPAAGLSRQVVTPLQACCLTEPSGANEGAIIGVKCPIDAAPLAKGGESSAA